MDKAYENPSANDNDLPAQYSTSGKQEDACIVACTQNGSKGDNAAEVDITLPNGNKLGFSAMVYEKGKAPARHECGIDGN